MLFSTSKGCKRKPLLALPAPRHRAAAIETLMPVAPGPLIIHASAARAASRFPALGLWQRGLRLGLGLSRGIAYDGRVGMFIEMEQAITLASGADAQPIAEFPGKSVKKSVVNSLGLGRSTLSAWGCHGLLRGSLANGGRSFNPLKFHRNTPNRKTNRATSALQQGICKCAGVQRTGRFSRSWLPE